MRLAARISEHRHFTDKKLTRLGAAMIIGGLLSFTFGLNEAHNGADLQQITDSTPSGTLSHDALDDMVADHMTLAERSMIGGLGSLSVGLTLFYFGPRAKPEEQLVPDHFPDKQAA